MMPILPLRYSVLGGSLSGLFVLASTAFGADVDPQVEKAMKLVPRQQGIAIETVDPAQLASCTKRAERRGEIDGLLILGPNSEPLRWCGDSNRDRKIDIWSYYKNGVEVYRDLDTNYNEKVDQTRWFGTAGIRWGIDENEDGAIDSWKTISAEEVTMEIVSAVRDGSPQRFLTVLLSDSELAKLGLGESKEKELRTRLESARADFEKFVKSQDAIGPAAKWTNFGADKPGIVPAGTNGSVNDIIAYENVVAIVDSNQKNEQLMIGSLVQVDENQWRATDIPRLVDENTVLTSTSVFFNADTEQIAKSAMAGGLSERTQDLLKDLDVVEKDISAASETQKQTLNAKRAEILEAIFDESNSLPEKETWARQFADTVSNAVQNKEYDDGISRLQAFESKVASISETGQAYVAYRIISSDYSTKVATASNSEVAEVQTNYLKQLEDFVSKYPDSPDSAEAMIQLGLNAELQNDVDAANKWYKKTADLFGDTPSGKKATGAVARLNLEGRTINQLAGKTIDGKPFDIKNNGKAPTIIHFWATWCDSCKENMKDLRKLQSKFASAKAKVNIVGVNLDTDVAVAKKFLADKENNYPWVHLYEQGGFEGGLPVSLGVFSLPVTIVLDGDNKVLRSTSHYSSDIETLIEETLKPKPVPKAK